MLDPTQLNSTSFNMNDPNANNYGQTAQMQTPVAEYPVFDKNVNYYHEFWKMYLENEVLISKMKESVVKSKEIQARISQLQAQCHEMELNIFANRKEAATKKKRRTASEIDKSFTCPYEGCNRNYGSDVSLNLHIKLKHGGGNKTEREKLAKLIIEAKLRGEELPEIALNLPPKFFESIDLDKLAKLKDKKKGRSKEEITKDTHDLKELLLESNLSDTDLATLLTDFTKSLHSEHKELKSQGDEDEEEDEDDDE
jgi:hypothetical protein